MPRPRMACLCESTRFLAEFDEADLHETLDGHIVLSIESTRGPDGDILAQPYRPSTGAKVLTRLAALHRVKIDLADGYWSSTPAGTSAHRHAWR